MSSTSTVRQSRVDLLGPDTNPFVYKLLPHFERPHEVVNEIPPILDEYKNITRSDYKTKIKELEKEKTEPPTITDEHKRIMMAFIEQIPEMWSERNWEIQKFYYTRVAFDTYVRTGVPIRATQVDNHFKQMKDTLRTKLRKSIRNLDTLSETEMVLNQWPMYYTIRFFRKNMYKSEVRMRAQVAGQVIDLGRCKNFPDYPEDDITKRNFASSISTIGANSSSIGANSSTSRANSSTIEANSPTIGANSPTIAANSPTIEANSPTIEANSPTIGANSSKRRVHDGGDVDNETTPENGLPRREISTCHASPRAQSPVDRHVSTPAQMEDTNVVQNHHDRQNTRAPSVFDEEYEMQQYYDQPMYLPRVRQQFATPAHRLTPYSTRRAHYHHQAEQQGRREGYSTYSFTGARSSYRQVDTDDETIQDYGLPRIEDRRSVTHRVSPRGQAPVGRPVPTSAEMEDIVIGQNHFGHHNARAPSVFDEEYKLPPYYDQPLYQPRVRQQFATPAHRFTPYSTHRAPKHHQAEQQRMSRRSEGYNQGNMHSPVPVASNSPLQSQRAFAISGMAADLTRVANSLTVKKYGVMMKVMHDLVYAAEFEEYDSPATLRRTLSPTHEPHRQDS